MSLSVACRIVKELLVGFASAGCHIFFLSPPPYTSMSLFESPCLTKWW